MANRYWVGGTATWDSSAGLKWATTSGGAGGASAPTPSDDVFFTNLSTGTCTIGSNSGAKSINCSGFSGTLTGTAPISIYGSMTLDSGMVFSHTGTKTFVATGTITGAGKTFGPVTIQGSGITVTLNGNLSLGTGSTALTLESGTIDLAGSTLSCGSFVSSNSNTRSISFGAGNISLVTTASFITALNVSNATNFTWTGTGGFTSNMAVATTMDFGSSGSSGNPINAPNLTVNAGASALTLFTGSWFKNVNFTGSTCDASGTVNLVGNLTLASGGTYTGLSPTFRASGTITSNSKELANLTIDDAVATVTLADALRVGNALSLTRGTFATANFSVTTNNFQSSNVNTRALNMGSSTFTVSGSGSFAFNISSSTGMTLNAGTSTISMTNAVAKTFAGGGLTYYNLNQGGSGALTVSGSNTFNNITNSGQPTTVTFTAGTTQTVSDFSLSGTAANPVTLNSSSVASQFTLSAPTGTLDVQRLLIRDSRVIGGALWVANNCVNNGNNTGWVFNNENGALSDFF